MSDIAIRVQNCIPPSAPPLRGQGVSEVEGLSKMYRIGAKEQVRRNLRQTARSLVAAPFDYLRQMGRPPTEEKTLWALRDVSFESLS
jgi:hypothetical protein